MLAWAHFLLTELRPLYAILFATSLYAESKTLQVGIWGDKKSTCWVNQIYKNCAERCGHVWHGQRCNCDSGAFRACEDNYNGLSEPQPVFIMDDSHLTSILNESSAFPSYARGHYAPYETVYYHYALFSLTLAIFVLANVLFLKFVGFSSKLNGRYVRFCLEIEHRHNFRKALKAYSLIIVVVIAAGWYTFWQLSSISPGQRDILELLLATVAVEIASARVERTNSYDFLTRFPRRRAPGPFRPETCQTTGASRSARRTRGPGRPPRRRPPALGRPRACASTTRLRRRS